jgi:hypothetical protein
MTGFSRWRRATVLEAAAWPALSAELDEARPLVYLMTASEQGVYSSLSLEGKRAWLRQFWRGGTLTGRCATRSGAVLRRDH